MIRLLDDFSITADKRSFVLHRADEVLGYFATVAAAVHWMRREMQMDMVSSERLTLKQAADRIEAMDQRILRLLGAARLDKLTKEDLRPGAVNVPEVDSVFQARVNTEGPASPESDAPVQASPHGDAPAEASPESDALMKGANHEGRTDADTGKTRTGNSRKGRGAAGRSEAGRSAGDGAGRSASGRTAAGRIS